MTKIGLIKKDMEDILKMETIEEDIYNACGLDPYCGDLFVKV